MSLQGTGNLKKLFHLGSKYLNESYFGAESIQRKPMLGYLYYIVCTKHYIRDAVYSIYIYKYHIWDLLVGAQVLLGSMLVWGSFRT